MELSDTNPRPAGTRATPGANSRRSNSRRSRHSLTWAGLLSALACAALIAGACGGDTGNGTGNGTASAAANSQSSATPDVSDISGTVNISGSSTVEPISVRVAELFSDIASNVNVNVDGPGTGDGFKLFCAGEIDISDASRQIKDSEAEDCAANGISWVELRVGIDGIAVMTNANNDLVDCLNFQDLYALVGPESQGFGSWSDARALAAELGSASSLPDAGLDIYGPGEESGTFDSFVELVLEDFADQRGQDATTRPDYSANADDNLILQGIQSDEASLGWVGFAHAANASNVKLLEIDGGNGCVAATADTIATGSYPISRSLYIYVNSGQAEQNPAVGAYVDYYMSVGLDQAVSEVGYVALTEAAKSETRSTWS